MAKKSILEQALLQVEAFEEVVKQNSKGVIAQTMKQELNDLLKEALEDEDVDDVPDAEEDVTGDEPVDDTMTDEPEGEEPEGEETDDVEEPEEDEFGGGDEESLEDLPDDEGSELPDEEDTDDTLDMTNASDGEVLKVFRAMKPEDGIIVKKDGNKLEFSVDDEDYIIKLDGDGDDKLAESYFPEDDGGFDNGNEYEIEGDDDFNSQDLSTGDDYGLGDDEDEDKFGDDEDLGLDDEEDVEEQMYEIDLDEDDDFDFGSDDSDTVETDVAEEISGKDPFVKGVNKTRNQKSALGGGKKELGKGGAVGDDDPFTKTANKSRNQKSALGGGKKELGKGGAVGDDDPFTKTAGKARQGEFVESARTAAFGYRPNTNPIKKFKAGNKRDQVPPDRARKNNNSPLAEQVETLKKQNGEYKKALLLFKDKLNEVAVFNANLAFATRLITENTTTKQEKLEILKRFDTVSTITESKKLFSTIKSELEGKKPVTETVVNKITSTPTTSSSQDVLSESKVYENAQFKRMKELMGVLKK